MPRPSLEEIFGKQPMQQQVVQATAQRPSLAEIFGQPKQAPITKTESALMGAADIGSFGLADEAQAALGAGLLKGLDVIGLAPEAVQGKSYGEMYGAGQKALDTANKQAFQENPVSYVAGGLGAGLLTGAAAGATKGGAALANSLRTGSLPARIAKGAAAGAASGALYGATGAEQGQRLEGAKQGAIYGGVAGAAAPAVGAAVKGLKTSATGLTARGAEALDESLSAIKDVSSQAYKKMRDSGAAFTPQASNKIVNQIEQSLINSGQLNKSIHGQTISVVKDLKNAAKQGNLGLEQLDQFRQLFGDLAGDIGNKANARTASIVKSSLDDVLDNLGDSDFTAGSKQALDALKQGRAEYARARKFEMIADVVKKSEGDPNYVKRELTKIVNNPKKARAFKDVMPELKEAARLGGGEAILKIAGKFGFDPSRLGSGVGAIFGSTGGALVGGATGAGIVPAVGTAAKYGLKLSTRGKTENLLRAIEQGAGKTVQSTPSRITPTIGLAGSGAAGAAAGAETRSAIPMAKTPPVTLPNATQPSTMDVVPFEQLMPEAQPNVGTVPPLTQEPFLPSPQSSIEGAISEAAQIGGASPDLLTAIAETESALNPQAQAKTSSAKGLFQLTDATWKALVNRYGGRHGITTKDITDPRANAIMAGYLTRDNTQRLSNRLGRAITDGEAYIAHFMGVGGAAKLLKGKPDSYAYRLFPAEAKANKNIFFAGNKPRTIAEVKTLLSNKVEDKIQQRKEREQQQQEQERQYAQQQQEAMMREREQNALAGLVSRIPQAAIQDLKNNPQLAGEFDKAFGGGAAAYFLA